MHGHQVTSNMHVNETFTVSTKQCSSNVVLLLLLTAASSVKWSYGRSSFSLVCGQMLTIWNIVWRLPHWHLSLVARLHFLWQN